MEYRITVLPEGRSVFAEAGTVLLDALRHAGCFVDAPCGGQGKCGKCAWPEECRFPEKASVYVEGLLTHGGPSTDVFKKGIGEEKTADLFRRVLFGTKL